MSSKKASGRRASEQVHVWLTPEMYRTLKVKAKGEQRRSVPDYVRALIERTVEAEAARG